MTEIAPAHTLLDCFIIAALQKFKSTQCGVKLIYVCGGNKSCFGSYPQFVIAGRQ